MYHRQAKQLIQNSRGSPLSTETVETLSSYLSLDYVFASTKVAILLELRERAESDEADAQQIATDTFTWCQLEKILASPSISIRMEALDLVKCLAAAVHGAVQEVDEDTPQCLTKLFGSPSSIGDKMYCDLVRNLARHGSSVALTIWELLCVRLVPLLWCEQIVVTEEARQALSEISGSPTGAQAVVNANVLEEVGKLLQSSNPEVRQWSCLLVGTLANHECTASAVLASDLTVGLVACLCDDRVLEQAVYALERVTWWPGGARAVADAMTKLLSSVADQMFCDLVRSLARHDSFNALAIWELLCVQLVPLLRHEDTDVTEQARLALSEISRWPNGAQAVVNANVLEEVKTLLQSSNLEIRQWSCLLVGALANHEYSALTVSASGLTVWLVPCLHDDYTIEQALYALEQIARWPYGARAVADANADYFMELLKSRDASIQRRSCKLIGIMAGQRSIASVISESKICVQLVSLVRHRNTDVIVSATAALVHIAKWEDGAQAVLAANALPYVTKLFVSQSDWVRIWACRLLGNLASHTSTGPATLDLYLFPVLTSLLRHKNVVARTSATFALARLSDWPNGIPASAKTYVLEALRNLDDEPDDDIQVDIRIIRDRKFIGHLGRQKFKNNEHLVEIKGVRR
ncbi:armadillo-type protein [Mycena galericulata]|nr:armadillo-type protein [Mycena galericulata]